MSSDGNTVQDEIEDLKVTVKGDINILLIGETGVGKSTFINSIATYLTYPDLNRAKKEPLLTLIPSKYEIKDADGKFHLIQTGSPDDKNEFLEVGVSATQDVKTYLFPIWGDIVKVRLIDTPGIGDTRGIEQDNINCENILSYIAQLHELHAICLLFKPTNARLTNLFEYCICQILSRLEKSASENIVFIFTNTRGTDYGPGETLPLLKRVVQNIKKRPPNVDIPLNLNRNIFCFDNEAFRYLAAMKQGVKFDIHVKTRNSESWKKSVDQCLSLIKYIVGDDQKSSLTPHVIKHTNAVNEARRLIDQLSKPLAEISELIHYNLRALERHRMNLNLDSNSLDELKSKLYMPVINLEVKELSAPVTVCTSIDCAEVYKVGDLNKWHYKTRCHDPCYLKNVPREIIGSPELASCYAMNPTTQHCRGCSHIFSIHMHIYYMTETKEDKIIDPSIQSNIDTKENILKETNKLIADISTKQNELEAEHDIIIKTAARFAHFLQSSAIAPFSDSYKQYIEYLIIQEESHQLADKEVLSRLHKLLKQYEEAKKIFDEALETYKKLNLSEPYITPQKIQESIEELYKLKHNGQKIKELYECQKQSRMKEHEDKTEYLHKVVSKQPKENNRQQRGRRSSPPPKYEDIRRPSPSTSPPTSPHHQPRRPYHPPPQFPGMYPPWHYYYYWPHLPYAGPNPYPQPPAGPHEYYPGYEQRPREPVRQRADDNTTFQVKEDTEGQDSNNQYSNNPPPNSVHGQPPTPPVHRRPPQPHHHPEYTQHSSGGSNEYSNRDSGDHNAPYPPPPYPIYYPGYIHHYNDCPCQCPNRDSIGQHHGPNAYEQMPLRDQYNQNIGSDRSGVTSTSRFKNESSNTDSDDSDDSDLDDSRRQHRAPNEYEQMPVGHQYNQNTMGRGRDVVTSTSKFKNDHEKNNESSNTVLDDSDPNYDSRGQCDKPNKSEQRAFPKLVKYFEKVFK